MAAIAADGGEHDSSTLLEKSKKFERGRWRSIAKPQIQGGEIEEIRRGGLESNLHGSDPNGWCVGAPATDRRSPGAIIDVVAHLSSFASEQKERSERQGFALPLLGDVTGADRPSSVLPGRHRPMSLCFGCGNASF
ncbi:hypothetical protein Dimus_008104 [Dionaea muscipula]